MGAGGNNLLETATLIPLGARPGGECGQGGLSSGPAVVVRGLSKRYGRVWALRGVTLSVARGRVVSVLGPNGAGKTTLLRAVSGMLRVPRGTVIVMGRDAGADRRGVKRVVGYVPETGFLFPELSVERNLELAARLRGVRDVGGAVRGAARRFGIEGLLSRPYGSLSKGLRRRADLAAGLIHEPEVAVLDEPTSGLDVLSVSQLRDLIRLLSSGGTTVILATHNIQEAVELSDEIALLRSGTLVAVGSPEEVARRLGATSEVVALLSSIPGGLVRDLSRHGRVRVVGRRVYVRTADPLSTVEALREAAERHGVEVRGLSVREAVWEEVFRSLAGSEGSGCACGCAGGGRG